MHASTIIFFSSISFSAFLLDLQFFCWNMNRTTSVILVSSDDETTDDQRNQPIQTQYGTPRAQEQQQQQQQQSMTTASPPFEEKFDFDASMRSPCGLAQRNYMPYTITALNQKRLSLLPTYPQVIKPEGDEAKKDEEEEDEYLVEDPVFLLLSNIPDHHLSNQERQLRRTGKYPCPFSLTDSHADMNSSFLLHQYHTYYVPILSRFQMDLSILDYNYLRLKKFIELCQLAYHRALPTSRSTELNFHVHDYEFPQLLEFFLQIDVDLFYMKTCSFRQAQPRLPTEGIFCRTTPECLYVMQPCGRCPLCSSAESSARANSGGQAYSVAFNLYQKHRFVNGYEAILNCPASCDTNNIIYALTCLCGQYDYLGETCGNLFKRLSSHQCFTHRLILETVIGEKNYERFWGAKTREITRKDTMRLYQHPRHCSTVIQSFLNQNTDYWIFVPMLNADANQENRSVPSINRTAAAPEEHRGDIQKCLSALPKPPLGYKFSNSQLQQQYEFFALQAYKKFINVNYLVYHSKIIALLPVNTSDLFRRLVHSLLVTHTEAKLNVVGHIFTHPFKTPISQHVWCENLRRRPVLAPHSLSGSIH